MIANCINLSLISSDFASLYHGHGLALIPWVSWECYAISVALRSFAGPAQRYRDSRKSVWRRRSLTRLNSDGSDPHEFAEACDFLGFQKDAPLPPWSALKISDRSRLAPDDEHAAVRLAEPFIKRGRLDSQHNRCFFDPQQVAVGPTSCRCHGFDGGGSSARVQRQFRRFRVLSRHSTKLAKLLRTVYARCANRHFF